jgi:hypothetical protein
MLCVEKFCAVMYNLTTAETDAKSESYPFREFKGKEDVTCEKNKKILISVALPYACAVLGVHGFSCGSCG